MENLKVIGVCFGFSAVMDDLHPNDDERMIALMNRRWYLTKKVSVAKMKSC